MIEMQENDEITREVYKVKLNFIMRLKAYL